MLDLGRMEDSLVICELGFAASIKWREHLYVWISERMAKERVGKGEQGFPRVALNLGEHKGKIQTATGSSQSRGSDPGISVMGLQKAGADGPSWDAGLCKPCSAGVCFHREETQAKEREGLHPGVWRELE